MTREVVGQATCQMLCGSARPPLVNYLDAECLHRRRGTQHFFDSPQRPIRDTCEDSRNSYT